jgi:GTPase SAR1 family protein
MKKTIFAGLDNSGKTSIIFTLQKRFSLLNNIRPTLGPNRSDCNIKLLGVEISSWDLGGQKKYRERYFKEKYGIFGKTALMYYVIDMLDRERFDESFEYLQSILQLYVDLNEKPVIIVAFHKIDPDRRKDPQMLQDIDSFKQRIEKIKGEFVIDYYNTSIHDEPSVFKMFSEGVLKISDKSNLIGDLLKEYAKTTFSSAVLLLDENSFIVGAHYTKKQYLDICETVAPRFAMTMERLQDYNLTTENMLVNLKFNDGTQSETEIDNEKQAMVFIKDFLIDGGARIYIVSLAKNEKTIKLSLDYLPQLAQKLQDFMKTFCVEPISE